MEPLTQVELETTPGLTHIFTGAISTLLWSRGELGYGRTKSKLKMVKHG